MNKIEMLKRILILYPQSRKTQFILLLLKI